LSSPIRTVTWHDVVMTERQLIFGLLVLASCTAGGSRNGGDAVTKLTGVRAVAAGTWHTCALLLDGTVRCWGGNSQGALGHGTERCPYRAVPVLGLAGATAIAAGDGYSCALLIDGTVTCWGRNDWGQLGDGSPTAVRSDANRSSSARTIQVRDASRVTAIAAGDEHACALLSSGRVKCWGANNSGQLGHGGPDGAAFCGRMPCSSTPLEVEGLVSAVAIAAAGAHSCALEKDGSVKCWGGGFPVPTSERTYDAPLTPRTVSGLARISGIVTGSNHACALL